MRVLLTGAGGLIGQGCAAVLADAGHTVTGLGRQRPRAEGLAESVALDLGTTEALADELGPFDAVVHSAAAISAPPPELVRTNCLGTQRVLDAAAEWDAAFVYISSVPMIGEPVEWPITESHPVAPLSVYQATKAFGEHVTTVAGRHTGLAAASLRLPAPVGPGMPSDRILPAFLRAAQAGDPLFVAGKGTRQQNYVHVRDVGAAARAAVERRASGIFNVAGAEAISNLDLAKLCVEAAGSSSPIEHRGEDPNDGIRWDISIEKARRELGWEPRISLAESVRELLAERA
jgi:nucleoside-diphosphate-sugar epimerase